MPVRRRGPRTLALLAMGLLLAACGGGVAPSEWARQVCNALKPWQNDIGTLTTLSSEAMRTAKTPPEAKENLVKLLGGAETASERARAALAGAGTPDVSNGAEIAAKFVATVTAARDAYGAARRTIDGLSTADAKTFYDAVSAAMDKLNKDYSGGVDPGKLSSGELQTAFRDAPECR